MLEAAVRADAGRVADLRPALVIHLELGQGRRGASARVELLERDGRRVAHLGLRGWIGASAMGRLGRTVADLAGRDVDGLVLDCSRLRHLDLRGMPGLGRALAEFAGGAEGLTVCGLPPRLRERFRAACGALAGQAAGGRERAS